MKHVRDWPARLGSLLFLLGLTLGTLAHADTQTRASAFEYDPVSGLLTKEIVEPDDPNLCLVTTYTYDSFGNKTGATTRNCNGLPGSHPGTNSEAAAPAAGSDAVIETRTSSTLFDAQGRFPVSSTNALGQTETRTFNAAFGAPASLTGPNGLTTTWTYDSFGRKLSESRADGTSTQQSYALCGTGISCPDARAKYAITVTQAGSPTSRTYYDMLDRVILAETQDKDGNLLYTQTVYDHLGRTEKSSRPYAANATPVWSTVSYDAVSRVIATTAPDGSTSSIEYHGLTTIATNALGQTRTEIKNSQGQLKTVTDTQGKSLNYTYDAYGNLTTTTDALGNVTGITYDKRGRKIAMNDPDQGQWSYVYDALGQLKKQTDAKLQLVTFQYDKLGRMTQRNEPDLISTWTYDVCDATLNPNGKCIGKPVKETADNGYVRTYLYDTLGRPTAELDNVDQGYGVAKTYDSYGRVANLVYPTGFQVTNVYSSTGYLIQVQDTATQLAYWTANTIDAEGRVITETYGNGVINTKTYNAQTGRLSQTQSGTSGNLGSVHNQSYVYDSLGNLTQRYDAVTGLNEAFGYDQLNRLTSTSAQAGGGPLTQVSLTYNAIGNILTKSDVGTYTYGQLDANGNLTKPHAVTRIMMNDGVTEYASYTYDANGNMLTGAGRTLQWTSWNMPQNIVGTTPNKSTPDGTTSSSFGFVYNSAHERVKEILPDGTQLFNISPRVDTGIHVEKRIKPDGTVTYAHSLYAGSFPFGTYTTTTLPNNTTTTKTRYFHVDHLGSIVAITDEAGNVAERRSYDAWGKRRNTNGTPTSNAFVTPEERHGFTGHEELNELGLIHMNGRLYDPATGRFLSADPTIQFPDDMQSYNRYSYLNNNPLYGIDPSGYGLFSKLKKAFKKILHSIEKHVIRPVLHAARDVMTNPVIGPILQVASAFYGGPIWAAAYAAASTYAATGSFSDAFQAALITFGTAQAFNGLHDMSYGVGKILAHGAVGGLSSVASGGDFRSGFLAAAFTQSLSPVINGIDAKTVGVSVPRTIAAAIAGGTASVIGGGKFANGAVTGAFSRMFNDDYVSRQQSQRIYKLGDGFEGAVDKIPRGGANAEHEIHIYKDGTEVGIFKDGRFIGKHGFESDRFPEGFSQDNFNKLKGLDVDLARAEGRLGAKGTINIKGNDYGRLIKGIAIVGTGGGSVLHGSIFEFMGGSTPPCQNAGIPGKAEITCQ